MNVHRSAHAGPQYFRPQTISVSQLFIQVCRAYRTYVDDVVALNVSHTIDLGVYPWQDPGGGYSWTRRNCSYKDQEQLVLEVGIISLAPNLAYFDLRVS